MHDLDLAIQVASNALAGQTDKSGHPAILHALRVMFAVPPEARVAALLHDVVEDTDVNLTLLAIDHGFAQVDVTAVDYLTRPKAGTYREYILRIVYAPGEAGRIARLVKVQDLRDNLSRPLPDSRDLVGRYADALSALRCGRYPSVAPVETAPIVNLDVVELLGPVGAWPAGTVGTVVEGTEDTVLVEVSGPSGRGEAFLDVGRGLVAPSPVEAGEGNAPVPDALTLGRYGAPSVPPDPRNPGVARLVRDPDPVNPNAAAGATVDA